MQKIKCESEMNLEYMQFCTKSNKRINIVKLDLTIQSKSQP
jgi:hypothetical protein